MCKDNYENYKALTFKTKKSDRRALVAGRGEGFTDLGEPYWHLEGADTESTVSANSKLGRSLLVNF